MPEDKSNARKHSFFYDLIIFFFCQSRAECTTEFLLELNLDVVGDFIEEVVYKTINFHCTPSMNS